MNSRRLYHAAKWCAALAVIGLTATACAASAKPPPSPSGGVVTFAELPSTVPNYISPLTPGSYFGNDNLYQFSNILYPPLYSFGTDGQPTLNRSLSIAEPAVFSDNNTVVTITLKHWVWSDGQPVTARDVTFWMNLLSAATDPKAPVVGSSSAPGPGWGSAVPGLFPYNVVSYKILSTYQLAMKLNASYNPTWFQYNELSQITPMPQQAWDRLSSGGPVGNYDESAQVRVPLTPATTPPQYVPASPGTATSGALGVAQYINLQAEQVSAYATNPMWKVVDGPFKLTQYTTSGFVKMVPNHSYSGSPKPTIAAFEEEPFTSDSSEYQALLSGALTIGYVPAQDLGQRAALEKSKDYSFSPWYEAGFTMARYNFTNPTVGPILQQLYVRQALQSLVNQRQYIKEFGDGIGTVTNGPAIVYPPGNKYEAPLLAHGVTYPFDPSKAVSLLAAHGWKVIPGGQSYCAKPGDGPNECGTGIRAGDPARFSELYAAGILVLQNELEAYQSALKQYAGITLTLQSAPFATVISTTHGHCTFATPCSDWEIGADGGGWTFGPDFYPTGGELFLPGAGPNLGDYINPTNTAYIDATHVAPTNAIETADLFRYESFLAEQLPDQFLPTYPGQYTMYKRNLQGVVPQNVFDMVEPQLYRFTS